MIRKCKFYIFPILIITTLYLESSGVLHIGYLYIKSHELRWTNLDYNYYPRDGDIFTAGESVSHNNYEDAVIAIHPDYEAMLQRDLDEISRLRDHIDSIDRQQMSFYSGDYMVKVCLDKKDISIKDSTLFKKLVNIEILGQYELYDKDGCELLFQQAGRKFLIRDKLILRGISRKKFIINKIEEIWLAQMSNNAHQIISYFEEPYILREKLNVINAYQIFAGLIPLEDLHQLEGSSKFLLWKIDRRANRGSRTYGHKDDANYPIEPISETIEEVSSSDKTYKF